MDSEPYYPLGEPFEEWLEPMPRAAEEVAIQATAGLRSLGFVRELSAPGIEMYSRDCDNGQVIVVTVGYQKKKKEEKKGTG